MRHGTPFMGDLGSRAFTDLAETVLEPHCSLILLPAFCHRCHHCTPLQALPPSLAPSHDPSQVSHSIHLLQVLARSCFSENLSSHSQGLKQCLMNKWLAQVHTASKTTDPELEPRSLVPLSKAFHAQITNHLRKMSVVPLSRGPLL